VSYSYAMTEGAEPPLPTPAENATAELRRVESRQFFAEQMEYARGRAAGLREALALLAREEA